MEHISNHDLERYPLGMVVDEADLAVLEEHLLWCEYCVDRTTKSADYVATGSNHQWELRLGLTPAERAIAYKFSNVILFTRSSL
jgi:hypothetical protein